MFFVGATGQLLTLILTVCLPFIFLVSGHQKNDIEQPALSFNVHQNPEEVSSFDFGTIEFEQVYFAEINSPKIEFEDSWFLKIPHNHFRVKQKLFYLNDSGNKAPPVSICFSC